MCVVQSRSIIEKSVSLLEIYRVTYTVQYDSDFTTAVKQKEIIEGGLHWLYKVVNSE